MTIKQFAHSATTGIAAGLQQELKIQHGRHYVGHVHNSSRVITLQLKGINPHYLKQVKGMGDQLTMFAGLDDRHKIRIGWQGANILIEIPKPGTYWQKLTVDQLPVRRGLKAILGLDLQDRPTRLNFGEPAMAHVFITGQTRSGKTNTQRLIGWNLAHNTDQQDARLIIFDVAKKGFKWNDFGKLTHLAHPIVTTVAEADRVLAWLTQEVERRGDEGYTTPRYFVLIDELKALTDDSTLAADYLARIASIGGEFGLHLILSTQYPQIKMLGNAELKRNVTTRLCGKVDDASAAANALGVKDSGAELLQGYGDFLLKDFNELSRLTVAKVEPRNIDSLSRTDNVARLELPAADVVNNGPKPARQPEPIEPHHVASALFDPAGINKLQKRLGIGGSRASRVKKFAESIRQWAKENGYNCLEAD